VYEKKKKERGRRHFIKTLGRSGVNPNHAKTRLEKGLKKRGERPVGGEYRKKVVQMSGGLYQMRGAKKNVRGERIGKFFEDRGQNKRRSHRKKGPGVKFALTTGGLRDNLEKLTAGAEKGAPIHSENRRVVGREKNWSVNVVRKRGEIHWGSKRRSERCTWATRSGKKTMGRTKNTKSETSKKGWGKPEEKKRGRPVSERLTLHQRVNASWGGEVGPRKRERWGRSQSKEPK